MYSQVEIAYNPYIPRTSILIEGKAPSVFSELNQYTGMDIWRWKNSILSSLYREVNDDFVLYFTGTKADALIVENQCKAFGHCLAFKYAVPADNTSLQKRMVTLNQFLNNKEIVNFQHSHIKIFVVLDREFEAFEEDFSSIEIRNSFCDVTFSIVSSDRGIYTDGNSYIFYVTNSPNRLIAQGKSLQSENPIFVLSMTNSPTHFSAFERGYHLNTTADDFIQSIFECVLTTPLLKSFRLCANSLSDSELSQIGSIVSTDAVIKVDVASEIEEGCSAAITVSCVPASATIPNIHFITRDNRIALTNNVSLFGKHAGDTVLEGYRVGEKMPFFSQNIHIIKRNRIKKIIMDDSDVYIGVGDCYVSRIDCIPDDADNFDSIDWKCTDYSVATVDKSGVIKGIKPGDCKVICVAENVSAQCTVIVLPYLEEIRCDIPLNKNRVLLMEPMQELNMGIELYPANSIDSQLSISTSNYDIVNVINQKLIAKKNGTAHISITNSTGRQTFNFTVSVQKKHQSFFKSIFGR